MLNPVHLGGNNDHLPLDQVEPVHGGNDDHLSQDQGEPVHGGHDDHLSLYQV